MKKLRNILAMLMVFVMLVAVMPMNVFAEPSNKHAIKIAEGIKNGSVTANPTEAAEGDTVTLTVKPAGGYELESLTTTPNVEVTDAEGTDAEVTKTFTMPGEDVTVTATFKEAQTEADKKAKELEDAKTKAKEEVGKLANLSEDEKTAAEKNIDEAKDKDGVDKAVTDAKALDTKNKKAADDKKAEELDKAKEDAKKKVDADEYLLPEQKEQAKKDIDAAKDQAALDKVIEAINKLSGEAKDKKVSETKEYTISKAYTNHGSFRVSKRTANADDTITVTAEPNYGYVVSKVSVYNRATKETKVLRNNPYKYYYGNGYYGRYNDYYKYLAIFNNSSYYSRKYDSYREFLRYEYPSHYRYYEDYDYWTDRYDYDWYNRYDNYYYRYLDDYDRNYSNRYDNYEEYLYYKHRDHYRDYYDYRYDFGYYNYSRYNFNTSDEFTMPASDVTVYVEFTDWSYYGYYYDDYYYYRYRRDKKDKVKEEKEKEEEEKKKVEEKTPQVYEASATINVGSNVFTKVNKNVTTTHQMDVAAYVKNGRVMLPLRYVAEALGLQVSWVPETKTVIIWDLTQRVEIPIKSNKMIVNGVTYTSDVKPEINNSRTMLPIANVARALGLIDGTDIIWDPVMKQVNLTRRVLSK